MYSLFCFIGGFAMDNNSLNILQEKIGYTFHDKSKLRNALTHSSFANERHMKREANNERLEFLGDAVLEIITSEYLFENYPTLPEGELTKKRASIVCEPTLAMCASEINLGSYLRLGRGEIVTGGRERNSITSDALEALIGAIYLDGGFASAKEFIHKYILSDIEHKQLFYDSKTILQEIVQSKYTDKLTYVILEEKGPDHNKEFVVQAMLGNTVLGEGVGKTKKAAEQEAAYKSILILRDNKSSSYDEV